MNKLTNILDGFFLAKERRGILAKKISKYALPPCLAVIIIGSDPASMVYVNNKIKACDQVGIKSLYYKYDDIGELELLNLIEKLNESPDINGILVQLPLPKHIDANLVIEKINPKKDVDGFHPYNLGKLSQRKPLLRPCTPFGIINLLEYYDITIKSKDVVIVGASNIVGRPMALEMLLKGASVTVVHKFSKNIDDKIKSAEILIVATGKRNIVKSEWIKDGSVVVDVGIHRLEDGSITGDLEFISASKKASWITPVPRGVGPMTILTLLENTLLAYQIQHKL